MTKSKRLCLRMVSALICVCCLLGSVQGMAAAPEQTAQTMTTKVRCGASYDSRVIGQMENGTQVTVLDTCGAFYLVDCYDMTGYIAVTQLVLRNKEYYVNCEKGSSETDVMDFTDHADALALRHSLLALAQEQLGTPYVYGGTSPSGFDCSGFVQYVYKHFGYSLPRGSDDQYGKGTKISKSELQPGDLVFFNNGGRLTTHVGIYIGGGKFVHSTEYDYGNRVVDGVQIHPLSNAWYAGIYVGARRIVK